LGYTFESLVDKYALVFADSQRSRINIRNAGTSPKQYFLYEYCERQQH